MFASPVGDVYGVCAAFCRQDSPWSGPGADNLVQYQHFGAADLQAGCEDARKAAQALAITA